MNVDVDFEKYCVCGGKLNPSGPSGRYYRCIECDAEYCFWEYNKTGLSKKNVTFPRMEL